MAPGDQDDQKGKAEEKEEIPPPFFRSWRRMYAFVLGFLVFQIGLYYLFTQAFS